MKKKGFKVIYECRQMIVIGGDNNKYMVWNLLLPLEDSYNGIKGHSHLNDYSSAVSIADKIAHLEVPHDIGCKWIYKSYLRCSNNEEYKRKKEKGQMYYNANRGYR